MPHEPVAECFLDLGIHVCRALKLLHAALAACPTANEHTTIASRNSPASINFVKLSIEVFPTQLQFFSAPVQSPSPGEPPLTDPNAEKPDQGRTKPNDPNGTGNSPAQPGERGDTTRIQDQEELDQTIAAMDGTAADSKPKAKTFAVSKHQRLHYFGDYELLEEIARGGMGVVYKARQTKLKRIVAVKMILGGQLASEKQVKRFLVEAEAAANLDHPGIVPVYEFGEHGGTHYFSMAFVDGPSLAEKAGENPLPPNEAAELLTKVAEAVAYAHHRGVVHRDLKPANVLIDQDGQPRITDFGLAKKIEADDGLTQDGTIMGSVYYMPPEQAAGETAKIGPAADIYSLGAILYKLLTGNPPFQAPTTMEILTQVVGQEPVPPQRLNPRIPRDLETICLKCLQKDIARRFDSADDLVDELERFNRGEPIRSRPISRWAYAWRWCRRNPLPAGLAAGLCIALLVGIITATTLLNRARSEQRRFEQQQRDCSFNRSNTSCQWPATGYPAELSTPSNRTK